MRSFQVLGGAVLLVAVSLGGCGPSGCAYPDRTIEQEVAYLVQAAPEAAEQAEDRLVRRGAMVIPIVETGLYGANVAGRLRVIRVLERIGDPESLPILEFLAANDPDETVRERASRGLEALAARAGATLGQFR